MPLPSQLRAMEQPAVQTVQTAMPDSEHQPSSAAVAAGHLRECPDCGLFQTVPKLRPGLVADCQRCGAVLRRRRRNTFRVTAALMLAGLALFSITVFTPLMGLRFAGREQLTTLPSL